MTNSNAARYEIIQYSPNPLNGERINIGVATYDEQWNVRVRFLSDWSRVLCFAGEEKLKYVQGIAETISKEIEESPDTAMEILTEIEDRWTWEIRVTDSMFATGDVDSLLDRMAKKFLVEEHDVSRIQARPE